MAETKTELTPEAVAKQLTEANLALEKRLKEAEDKASAAEQKANEQAETVAKVLEERAKDAALVIAKSMDKLPGKTEETAHLLFVAKRKLDAEDYAALEKVLKACDAQIKASKLFSVSGSDADGEGASDLDNLVAKRQAETKESAGAALAYVMSTPEGKAAYSAVRGH